MKKKLILITKLFQCYTTPMQIQEVLKISRPRFWLYEAATFAFIGALGALQGFGFVYDWRFWLFTLYFLIPANILIYGINDIFDYETDKLNPKKGTYEALVTPEKQKQLWLWIILNNIPFLFFVPKSTPLLISFFIFIFCATFYSAYPIRAKAKPVIDSLFSAGHYVATGVFGYFLAGGTATPTIPIVAGMLWAIAMHAYSAVPDIKADTEAKLKTIAILIGGKNTIYLCWILYLTSAYLVNYAIPVASILGSLTYSYVMYKSLQAKTDDELFKVYTYFPWINSAIGALISIELLAKNLNFF
ncbi:MAG: prenyltransferase [Candidatus Taylorbacteria bacterium]|nr:prenyltransferase [Candidatus Taylorbacteria bacterium]